MNARHLMVPGLCARHLDGGYVPSVREFVPRQRARLVCSFPASVATVETTLLTGFPASHHGVLFAGESPRVPTRIDAWHTRLDHLLEDPEGGAAALDAELRTILASHPDDELLLVSGAPPASACRKVVRLDPDEDLQLNDSFALCVMDDEPAAETLHRWLATPGIERVLAPAPESAGAWMAPTDRGWILVAEPGWGFREAPQLYGHPVPGPGHGAVLLAFGPVWSADWPDAIHDWRVAPTLLAARGEAADVCFDRPLHGADSLGS